MNFGVVELTRFGINEIVSKACNAFSLEGNIGSGIEDRNTIVLLLQVCVLDTRIGFETALELDVLGRDISLSGGECN